MKIQLLFQLALIQTAICLACFAHPSAIADDFSVQNLIFSRLTRPMKSIVDGNPFREAIDSIGQQAELNIWLDRRVDPTTPVTLGPIGPTPFLALEQIAQSRECVVAPLANVLLIGRKEWVDQTMATIVLLDLNDSSPSADIGWDDLTTPHEALEFAVGVNTEIASVDVEPALQHDLWPSVRWRSIDRRVAVSLILAQFDRRPIATESLFELKTQPASDRGDFVRHYRLGKSNGVFRKTFLRSDRNGQIKSKGESLVATGNISAHRLALRAVLASIRPESADIEKSTFTIQQMRTSAKLAFEYFAKLAGRSCSIDPDVLELCRQLVSIEGKDLTLRQLTQRVASEVGVSATWTVDTIVISRLEGNSR